MIDIGNATVKQLKPQQKDHVPLKNLYLSQNLKKIAQKVEKALVYTAYITDINDVIAKKDAQGKFQVADELKNEYDWRLFQELLAQADVFITGGDYFHRFEERGDEAQNVLTQFEPGGAFEELGNWRLENGFSKKSPDITIVSRSLDFNIPQAILDSGRKVSIFTTYQMYESEKAFSFMDMGISLVAAGVEGVDGQVMVNQLQYEMNYQSIMMTTGPQVLNLLLKAKVLDRLYITQVQREIGFNDPSDVLTIFKDKKVEQLEEFQLSQVYVQENAEFADGTVNNQSFMTFDHQRFLYGSNLNEI